MVVVVVLDVRKEVRWGFKRGSCGRVLTYIMIHTGHDRHRIRYLACRAGDV